jgi:hypothetical protein
LERWPNIGGQTVVRISNPGNRGGSIKRPSQLTTEWVLDNYIHLSQDQTGTDVIRVAAKSGLNAEFPENQRPDISDHPIVSRQ